MSLIFEYRTSILFTLYIIFVRSSIFKTHATRIFVTLVHFINLTEDYYFIITNQMKPCYRILSSFQRFQIFSLLVSDKTTILQKISIIPIINFIPFLFWFLLWSYNFLIIKCNIKYISRNEFFNF